MHLILTSMRVFKNIETKFLQVYLSNRYILSQVSLAITTHNPIYIPSALVQIVAWIPFKV